MSGGVCVCCKSGKKIKVLKTDLVWHSFEILEY